MIQCDWNIIVVSETQLLVHKSSSIFNFWNFSVKKSKSYKIPKCTPFWHEMFKIALVFGAPPQASLGSLRRSPDALVVRDFLPWAIEASRLQSLQFPRTRSDKYPHRCKKRFYVFYNFYKKRVFNGFYFF